MILTLILLLLIGAIGFFHYLQGFFSAAISAMLAIISAVLAFSLHEKVVDTLLGGRFSDTAHAIALAALFLIIYGVLRLAFDKMVPGNVRFPVIVDKVGGAAMGVVAGVFAGGIVAIVAQYMPLKPSVAGYARYAVDNRSVTIPPEGTGGRSLDSETWDELKTPKPGQLDPGDKQTMMLIPMDDIVVNTVGHLSDGGSLAWDKPLKEAHPDFLQELFAQRLGVQNRATRVALKDALQSVDLYRLDSIERRDHEYKEIRQRPFEATPLKPTNAQLLVVVRALFNRSAVDKDGLVRFSPGAVRLVARRGTGASAEWVNYYPIGTVDNAKTLYTSAPDDYLFADAKSADSGADFAFLVDKSGFAEGGQAPTAALEVAEGTFLEFKRLAREDLGGKKVSPPGAYKPSPRINVMRKKTGDAQQQQAAAANPADALKEKLVGNWAGTSDTGQLVIDFRADGSLTFTNTPTSGTPQVGQGTWEVVGNKTTADTLVINRTVGGATAENVIKFTDDNNMTLTSGQRTLQLQKR
jgi:hypothetical protein